METNSAPQSAVANQIREDHANSASVGAGSLNLAFPRGEGGRSSGNLAPGLSAPDREIPILIAGGGPVGLVLAIEAEILEVASDVRSQSRCDPL